MRQYGRTLQTQSAVGVISSSPVSTNQLIGGAALYSVIFHIPWKSSKVSFGQPGSRSEHVALWTDRRGSRQGLSGTGGSRQE